MCIFHVPDKKYGIRAILFRDDWYASMPEEKRRRYDLISRIVVLMILAGWVVTIVIGLFLRFVK